MLDHHKTAADTLQNGTALPGNLEVNLDMQRSGARLALDYFQPQAILLMMSIQTAPCHAR